jgi:hypothetical protein
MRVSSILKRGSVRDILTLVLIGGANSFDIDHVPGAYDSISDGVSQVDGLAHCQRAQAHPRRAESLQSGLTVERLSREAKASCQQAYCGPRH